MTTYLRRWVHKGVKAKAWYIHVLEGVVEVRKRAPKDSREREAQNYEREVRVAIREDAWCVPCVEFKAKCTCVLAPAVKPPTLSEFAKIWQARNALECASGTVQFYADCLKNIEPQFKDVLIRDVEFPHVETFKAYLQGAGYAVNTIDNNLATLRALLTYAEKMGYFGAKGAPAVDLLERTQGKAQYLDDKQVKRLLHFVAERFSNWEPFFVFLLETGLRIGEAIALQQNDIVGDMLHVNRTYYRGEETPAGSAARRIPLSPKAVAALNDQKKVSIYVFPNIKGGRATEASHRIVFKAAKEFLQKGLQEVAAQEFVGAERYQPSGKLGPHVLRHTFATKKASEGVPLKILAELMGHKSVSTTEVYAKVTVEALRAAMGQKRGSKP